MSLRPVAWPEVPEQTAVVARAAFPRGSLAMRLRDELGPIFLDTDFHGAFGVRGRPGISPAVLMLVTILQFVEQMTDRQAAQAVAGRIDWKYALGLELAAPGFDHSVLSEFRGRLVEHDLSRLCFDRVLDRCRDLGLVKAGGKQRTDSTHVIAAVRDLTHVELAGEAVPALSEALAAVAPDFLAATVDLAVWAKRYGPRVCDWNWPRAKAERDELAERFGRDGRNLITALFAQRQRPWLRELPQVAVLCTVLRQNYLVETAKDGSGVMRRRTEKDGVPPAPLRLASPHDPDARWAAKGKDLFWLGYKLHLTETCEDPDQNETPNLITNVHTTAGTTPDNSATVPIHRDLAERGLAPAEHCLDSGHPSMPTLAAARREHGITMITPLLGDSSRQAKTRNGYNREDFTIDYDTRTATCPQGQTSAHWNPQVRDGIEKIHIAFPQRACWTCDAQPACTTSKVRRRAITVYPREIHELQQATRAVQDSKHWRRLYQRRAGIEGTINQAANSIGLRKARYRGHKKVTLEHYLGATAINITRLDAYLTHQPLDHTHTSRLIRLQAGATN